MSQTTRNFFAIVISIIVGYFVLSWAFKLAIGVLVGLIPLALVVGGIYVAYQVFGKKALSGGRRTLL